MERLEKIDPNLLRTYAGILEKKERMVNVEKCVPFPWLDQNLLLTLNRTRNEMLKLKNDLPNTGIIWEWIKKRLVEVHASDKQSVILGLFYTAIYPLKKEPLDSIDRKPEVVIGVFPLYNTEIKYELYPYNEIDREKGKLSLIQESAAGRDPFLVKNLERRLDFLFFEKSPFGKNHPYKINWSEKDYDEIIYPDFLEMSLEENLINHALCYLDRFKDYRIEPELFKKTGLRAFVNNHSSNPNYIHLHAALTQLKKQKPQ